jgi:hypothetical protein
LRLFNAVLNPVNRLSLVANLASVGLEAKEIQKIFAGNKSFAQNVLIRKAPQAKHRYFKVFM